MNANVSFRHMDSSPSLRNYATKKLEHICEKYVQGNIDAQVVMSVERFWHIADFTLQIKNLTVKGTERSEDMYSSIDLALDKIERQLRRHKDRLRDHKPTSGTSRMFKMGVIAAPSALEEESEFEEFADDFELYPAPAAEAESVADEGDVAVAEAPATNGVEVTEEVITTASGAVKLLRNQAYEARPMTIDEAALQLDLLENRQFFVFTNAETNAINVIYKRDDQNFGLIET